MSKKVKFELCHFGCFGNACVLTEIHRGYTSNLIGDEMDLLDKKTKAKQQTTKTPEVYFPMKAGNRSQNARNCSRRGTCVTLYVCFSPAALVILWCSKPKYLLGFMSFSIIVSRSCCDSWDMQGNWWKYYHSSLAAPLGTYSRSDLSSTADKQADIEETDNAKRKETKCEHKRKCVI